MPTAQQDTRKSSTQPTTIVPTVRDNQGRLLAPNGQPSKLNERQWHQVRTPQFKAWFGDWEAVIELEISANGIEKEDADVALSAINGKDLINRETGIVAKVSSKQSAKLVSNAAVNKSIGNGFTRKQHYAVAAKIESLWRHALMVDARGDKDGDVNIASIKRFAVPVVIDGKTNFATMLAKESVEHGHRVYTVEMYEIKTLRGMLDALASDENTSVARTPTRSVDVILDQLQKMVNPATVSKIVDENGEPLVVYHGTKDGAFSIFSEDKRGSNTFHNKDEVGFHFTTDKHDANVFAGGRNRDAYPNSEIKNVFLRITNPFILQHSAIRSEHIKEAIDGGYDGIIAPSGIGSAKEFVVFSPTQIKSATENNGDFSPTNPDIRYSRKQTPAAPANPADRFKDYGKPMGHLLTFLTRDMVVDLYKTRLPELVTYQRVQDQIEADVNTMLAEADDFKNKMMHLPRKQRDILAALAHESTIAGLDPSEEVTGRVSRLQAFVDKGELDLRTIGLSASKIRLLDRIKAELEKNKIKHADLRDRYLNQLTPESQLIFTGLRDSYQTLSAKVFEELENRILRMNVDPASQQAAIVELRKEYDSTMQQIYFPLARFGDFVIEGDIEIDGVPTYHVEYKEWHSQAKAAKDKMIADGYTNVTITARKAYIEQQAKTQAVSKVIVKVREMRDTGRANSIELDKLLDDINQAIIQMQPDASYRRHFMHRKNIPGYSDDFIRAYATTNKHAATHIANLRHSDAIDNSIEAMQKQVNSIKYADKTVLQEVVDHIREREELNRLAVNPAVARIAQISFLAALASLGNFIVNVTQTPKFTFPYLSGEYGFKRAGYHLSRAYGAQMFSIRRAKSLEGVGKAMDMRNRLTGDELAIFNLLHDSGKLDLTQAYDIIDAANRDTPDNPDSWWNKGMKIAALPQHTSELINRQVSALAAIRLEMERSGDTELAFFAAVQAIITTHFNYAKNNRAKIMSGSLGRLAFIFRQYAANAIYLWARTTYQSIYKDEFVDDATAEATRTSARKRVAGMLAMSMLLSGVLGLPIYLEAAVVGAGVTGFKHGGKLGAYLGVAMVAAAAMAIGDDEEKFDAEVRRLMAEYLGDKDLAEMIARGAVRGLGADIASRVNDDQLLLRRPDPGLEGEKEWQAWVEAVLGFTLGFGANVHAGIEMMQEGDVWRGLEKATPIKQARDMMIATRWAHEGVLDKKGNDLLEDSSDGGIKPHEIAMKAVGIQPARIANAYERNNAIKYEEKFLTRARGKLMDDYIEARELRRKTGDFLPLYEVNDRIRDFSLEHPAFKITQANKESAIDSRDNAKEETIEGLRLPKARAYLRDKYDY
jgi:hypothetical protein